MDIESKYEELLDLTRRLVQGVSRSQDVSDLVDEFYDNEWTESEWESSSC